MIDTKLNNFKQVSKRLSRITEGISSHGGDFAKDQPSQWKTNVFEDFSDFDSPMKSDRSNH